MIAAEMVSDEELQRHIRWQVLVDYQCGAELWANLPADMTPTLEWAAKELWARPIIFSAYRQYSYSVFPSQTQTNLTTGVVRQLQRIAILRI